MKRSGLIKLLALIGAAVGVARIMRSRDSVTPPPEAPASEDVVEEWGEESFPASDPPAHW